MAFVLIFAGCSKDPMPDNGGDNSQTEPYIPAEPVDGRGVIAYVTIMGLSGEYSIENRDATSNVPYVTKNGAKYCYYDNWKGIFTASCIGEMIRTTANSLSGKLFGEA